MANPTTNLGMTKPTVGGSTDTWGTTLNENVVDIIDALFSISGTDVTMSDIKFNSMSVQETGAGTDTVKIQAPAAVTTSYTLTMPAAVGTTNQVLSAADGSGTLAWTTPDVGDITAIVAGAGLTGTSLSGPIPTLNVIGTADKITVSADAVTIASTYVGQTSITTLGTIATGTWEGTTVAVDQGGTGATTLTDGGVLLGSGTGAITATSVLGDGEILIGDASGDPATLDVGSSTAITILGTVATGVWNGTAIANANLANSSVSYGGVSVSLGASDATPAFDLTDATNYGAGDLTGATLASGVTASSLTTVGTLTGLALSGNITMADDTSIGISDSDERIEFDGAGDISVLGADLGIGISVPVRPLQVALVDTEMVHFGGLSTNDAGEYCGIGLGQIDAAGDYNKVAIVYEGNGSGSYFGKFHVLSSSTAGSASCTLSNIAFTIDNLQNTVIPAAKKLYLDGAAGVAGNTYITESSADVIQVYANGAKQFECSGTNLAVVGELTAGTKTFRIDHPLADKKDTHDLVHSCLEGPRIDLIYRGKTALGHGSATVDLDEAAGMSAGTWELLCRDPQVWVQNDSGWDAVRGSVSGHTLTISCADSDSGDTVSWMVVAERQDAGIKSQATTDSDGRLIIEPEKAPVA